MREGPIYLGAAVLLLSSALLARAAEDAAPAPVLTTPSQGAVPRRIVSATLSTDEMLLALLPPERLVALSTFADDPAASNVVEEAGAVSARVSGDAERILALSPDLVVTNPYTRPEAMLLLARSRVPVLTVAPATTVEGIEDNLRTLARAIGAPERAEPLVEEMRATLAEVATLVRGQTRPRVLLYNRGGYTPGRGTLFDALLDVAGGDNAAREVEIEGHGIIGDEELLVLDPDVILVVTYAADGRGRQVVPPPSFVESPVFGGLTAVREGNVREISPRRILSASHHAAEGARDLARILHPRVFGPEVAP
jgi:iron complex transport system substrate-binding protein